MSVYTAVDPYELKALLSEYDLGTLVEYKGISDGIENTNYSVTTTRGGYVLTLFESIGFDDLPYCLNLMAFMAEHGVQSAHPIADRSGRYLRTFKHKPAALAQRLQGSSVIMPNLAQCQTIGEALGHLHREGLVFNDWRENTRGLSWWQTTAERLLPYLNAANAALLREELYFQAQHYPYNLPQGVIHGDLFRDNALFVGNELTGIVDFYYACNDLLLYDLAVTVNDWCTYPDDALQMDKARAILSAYHQQRPLQDSERNLWPVLLRAAALRFWLSRLQDRLFPRCGELTQIKDPGQFERILRSHIRHHAALRDLWV